MPKNSPEQRKCISRHHQQNELGPMIKTVRFRKKTIPLFVLEVVFFLRGLFFLGRKYQCPCCGWHLRALVDGNSLIKQRSLSYCPRCNSKSRHRRIWLFLRNNTNLFTNQLRLLEISPKYSFSRRFTRMKNLDYLGADIVFRPHIALKMDLTRTSLKAESFDTVLCIHVLEEIIDDRQAMKEIFRLLKPSGWAIISVPTRMDQLTYEDLNITDPNERKNAFGEPDHVRVYGSDLASRLEASGFEVYVDLAENVPHQVQHKFGLKGDENIFYCVKPNTQN